MLKGAAAAIVAILLCSTAAIADDDIPPVVGGHTYVQHQIVAAQMRHPQIARIEVTGLREDGKGSIVLGSTSDMAKVMTAVAHPDDALGATAAGDGMLTIRKPFFSNTHHRIGTIAVTFRSRAAKPTAAFTTIADRVAADLAHATLSAKNAADPYPYDPHFDHRTYAQSLTDRIVAAHPDLLVMMIHATPPGTDKNVIIGSNIGRLGKVADDDDLRVIRNGETNLEIGGDKDRFETELPLNDAAGKRIGALGLVFHYRDGADREAIHNHGLAIRDEIARQIPTSAALFAPAH